MRRHQTGCYATGAREVDGNDLSLFRFRYRGLFRDAGNSSFSMGRLGRCRERFDWRLIRFLRRSLERGVTLAAVTGTGR